jgi:hypothetical protein
VMLGEVWACAAPAASVSKKSKPVRIIVLGKERGVGLFLRRS